MNYRGILVATLFFFIGISEARPADMVRPNPDIAAAEVVAIQLIGLQYNDAPNSDAGIRQAWNFAHPRNREATGPLSRFVTMLKGPSYRMMLNHISHEILPTKVGNSRQEFDVLMEIRDGTVVSFTWSVEKVNNGRYENCWMTVAVSEPKINGQGS